MISPEEKKAFLDGIIPSISHSPVDPEIQQKLYTFLIRDTNSGNLYKYLSFDKEGHSLNSLTNGTLYCSKPTAFNDPFDCRLGITYTAFADAAMNYTHFSDLYKGVEDCIRGAKPYEQCNEDEQLIVRFLLSNPAFVALVNDLKRKKEKASFSEKERYIKELTKATYGYFLLKKIGRIPEGLMHYIDKADYSNYLSLDHPPTFFDHLQSLDFQLIDGDEITNVREFFRSQHLADDEKLTAFDDTFTNLEKEMANNLANAFRIGCLAGNQYNRLMWSHYGDSHRGFCIEYDVGEWVKKGFLVLPVYYSQTRPLIVWDPVDDPKSVTNLTTTINAVMALLTKDQCWEYENEWRVLRPTQLSENVEIPISAVYLGANISPEHRETIIRIARERNIPVKQMRTDRGEYKLHAQEVFP